MADMKRRTKKPKKSRLLFSMCLLAFSVFFIVQIASECSVSLGLSKDIKASSNELSKLKEEKKDLEEEKKNLQDPNYVEDYARGKYMATKEGEQVFILPND